jgi:glycosyltransferase involved in cell wall biosynthesis
MTYKVSAIIPTIKFDSWLDEAVNSLLDSQGIDLQLIVVLDGLEPANLPRWATDSRVEIIPIHKRSGQANAMNVGIQKAHFELIARLDADDLSSPDRLYLQAEYLNMHPETVAVGSRVMRVDQYGAELQELKFPAGSDIRRELLFQNVVAHSSLMFRKSLIQGIGGYKADMRQMEDYEFILRLAGQGPIANLDSLQTFYRVHGDQISRGVNPSEGYIRQVLKERLKLASALRVSGLYARMMNFIWVMVQHLRYKAIIKSGVDRYS